jgi:NAD(P)H dehydrogenase (quinone)
MRALTRREAIGAVLTGSLLGVGVARAQARGNEKIIISGASGQLGGLAVKWLLKKGVPAGSLILVSRTPEHLGEYAKLGAATRFGDFALPQSLPTAYAGGARMLLVSVGFSKVPRPEAHRRAIEAAKGAGVRQIAYTSWVGITKGDAAGIAVDHLATENILRESGLAWTFLRNSLYMEVLLAPAAKIVTEGRAAVPSHEDRIGFVARADCAAAAAAAVLAPVHGNRAYDITGPELLGVREVALAAGVASGRSVTVLVEDPGTTLLTGIGGPAASVVSSAVADLTGAPPIALSQFFAANRLKLLG